MQTELKETSIDLKSNNNILLGKHIIISGYLNGTEGNYLCNKGVDLYIDDIFIKTLITNDKGFFKDFLLAKFAGNRQIKCVYNGDWEYGKCLSKTNVRVIGENNGDDGDGDRNHGSRGVHIVNKLDNLVNLYEKGLLSDDEFKAAKEKLLKK